MSTVRFFIVVIDDECSICDMLVLILEGEGYFVWMSGSVEDGLVQLEVQCVDLVVLDVRFPGMDGLVAFVEIKDRDAQMDVVMIFGYAILFDVVEVTRLGVFDFL